MPGKDIKIHRLQGIIEDIYIAEYPDKLLLLDGGARPDIPLIEEFITHKLNRPLSDLRLIVATHMHPDHAGAAPFLREKYNIPIAAHKEADEWYSGLGGWLQHLFDTFLARYVARKKGRKKARFSYPRKLKPDYLLNDSDRLPFFADWKVIHSPGHTAHQITLYNEQARILYAADVLLNINSKFVLPFPVELKLLCQQTLTRLARLDIDTLLLAHGGTWSGTNTRQIFLELIPSLNAKLKFPMTIIRFFVGYNPPVRKYKKQEKQLKKSEAK